MELEGTLLLVFKLHLQKFGKSLRDISGAKLEEIWATTLLYSELWFGLQGDPTSPFWRRSALGFLWKDWCWSWNSSTLATSCEELTHWKGLWCWEGLGAEGEGDDRGWVGWMASLTQWTWVWVNSGSWWWTGRPGVLQLMGLQRVGDDWATELNWTEAIENWSDMKKTPASGDRVIKGNMVFGKGILFVFSGLMLTLDTPKVGT